MLVWLKNLVFYCCCWALFPEFGTWFFGCVVILTEVKLLVNGPNGYTPKDMEHGQ